MSASRELQRQLRRMEPCLPRAAKTDQAQFTMTTMATASWPSATTAACRLYSRNGYDFAERFPLAAAAIRKLPVRSCLVDGEAIVCDANGLAVFDLLRRWGGDDVILCAFDLLELDGQDMRRLPIEERKAALAKLLHRPTGGIAFNEHYSGDGAIIWVTVRQRPSCDEDHISSTVISIGDFWRGLIEISKAYIIIKTMPTFWMSR